MKKGFVFDLDGVITDTAKFHYEAWKNLASELGIEIDLKFNEQLKGISRMDSLDKILEHGNQLETYSEEEKLKLADQKNKEYLTLLEELTPNDVLPGVKEFLEEAAKHNVPCVIASASKNAPYILEKLEVSDYFDYVVDPSTLAKGKPDPEIFVKAAQAIGLSPEEAVGFEDSQAGVNGINEAGMYSVGIILEEMLHDADLVVRSFEELNVSDLLAV